VCGRGTHVSAKNTADTFAPPRRESMAAREETATIVDLTHTRARAAIIRKRERLTSRTRSSPRMTATASSPPTSPEHYYYLPRDTWFMTLFLLRRRVEIYLRTVSIPPRARVSILPYRIYAEETIRFLFCFLFTLVGTLSRPTRFERNSNSRLTMIIWTLSIVVVTTVAFGEHRGKNDTYWKRRHKKCPTDYLDNVRCYYV